MPAGVSSQPPSALRPSSHALRRLLGHKRTPQNNWVPPGAAEDLNWKRAPNGLGASGFYGDVFNQGFGAFSPVKRAHQPSNRQPEATAKGLHREMLAGDGRESLDMTKRMPEMTANGFYDDVFRGEKGHLEPLKRRPEMSASGFYDDVFRGDLGHFEPMKRRPEMSASGFYDDIFRGDMGHFEPMKRRPEMSASGFYDDVFRGGMGHFEPMKRRPEMSASGFYDDIFRGDMGHFEPMKRRPEMSASGFYDDVFRGGMGHFDTMKRIVGSNPSNKVSDGSGILSHVRVSPSQTARDEAEESRTKRNADDETMSGKGLRSEIPSGSEEELSMTR